ncbi:MAG: WecB/TagA/CpsF family glycosyltransferase [Ruminococcaceae bacterium]|nr:WecB/TagA/CpsF family glycosyltransferase [Oscillospiraceae bacterium]
MSEKISVRGVNFNNVDLKEATDMALSFIETREKAAVIHTPNSEIVQLCIEQPEMYEVINSADLIIPDGIGVVMASKIKRTPLKKGKVAGIDLCRELIKEASERKLSVFFLGGRPGVAEAARDALLKEYPNFICSGVTDGYFKKEGEESDKIVEKINSVSPHILLVCLGCPAQEKWMYQNRNRLKVGVMGGFGGSLDVFAGNVKRAPDIFIKLGLEWFYRLLKEPKRIGRMMKLPKFLIGTVFSRDK